jgi:hypothetical protein
MPCRLNESTHTHTCIYICIIYIATHATRFHQPTQPTIYIYIYTYIHIHIYI